MGEYSGDVLRRVSTAGGDVLAESSRAVFHTGDDHVGEVLGELRSCVSDELLRCPCAGVIVLFGVAGEVHNAEVVEGDRQGNTLASGVQELLYHREHRGELCTTRGGAVIGWLGIGCIY